MHEHLTHYLLGHVEQPVTGMCPGSGCNKDIDAPYTPRPLWFFSMSFEEKGGNDEHAHEGLHDLKRVCKWRYMEDEGEMERTSAVGPRS